MGVEARPLRALFALEVKDAAGYERYRNAIAPILERHAGSFTHDFEVSRVLKAPISGAFNRMFILSFPDRDAFTRFFADPEYLAARRRFFEPAVGVVHSVGEVV